MEELDIKCEALLCAMSRVLINHPAAGRKLLEAAGSVKALQEGGSVYVDKLLGIKDFGEMLFSKSMLSWGKDEALWLKSKGVKILHILSEDYPRRLRECAYAPFILYYRGMSDFSSQVPALSVVGTRTASSYGRECCATIISDMVEHCSKIQIISGLAIGIDGAAHVAALESGAQTIAVLPCGMDSIYPAAHRELAIRILNQGGILTEYPRGTKPIRRNFLQRNRIIAGLADAVLVVESRVRGGSMSTVEFASSYNRDIFAVPGRMTDANSYGCNYLINKNIAQLCLNASTIVSSMGWVSYRLSDIVRQPDLFSCQEGLKEKILLSLTAVRGKTLDYLAAALGEDIADLSLALLQLDIEGKVRKDLSDLWYKK